jgi:hypothetical protein
MPGQEGQGPDAAALAASLGAELHALKLSAVRPLGSNLGGSVRIRRLGSERFGGAH